MSGSSGKGPESAGNGDKTILLTKKDTETQFKTIGLETADCQNISENPHEATVMMESGGARQTAAGGNLEETISVPLRQPEHVESPLKRKPSKNVQKATRIEKDYFNTVVRKDSRAQRYKFIEEIVTGGMGAIFKVIDSDLQRATAMKVILPNFRNEKDTLDDFVTEAKITGFLEHPNIIPVHELGLLNSTGLYFTMKLAQGEPLNSVLDKLKRGDPACLEKYNTFHLLRIFSKICDALAFAHSKSFIHQDIKPHNIMIGLYGEVLLMDWGLGRYIGDPETESDPILKEILMNIKRSSTAKEEMIKGSPPYMSPEQTKGEPNLLDERSDIFLLGATLYHMFTLHPPYMAKDIYEILYKAENCDFVPPEERNPASQIPREICRIIKKAMAADKKDRYQSVPEFSKDVDDVISGKWTQEEKKSFPPGKLLMREGETGDEAYLIIKGKVEVFKEHQDKKMVLGTLGEGDIVGEMALITQDPRSASVAAVEPTETAVLTKRILSQNIEKLPPFMGKIVSTLTERLQAANRLINPHSTSDSTFFILEQLRLIFKDKSVNKIKDLAIPLHVLTREISDNLGIPESKVSKTLKKAHAQSYIAIDGASVRIPNIAELTQYTRFGKLITRLPPERQEVVFDSIRKQR